MPTNFTSLAFFTASEYGLPKSPVVLSADTTQPMLRKSPTVAAVLSLTVGADPSFGLDKSTRPFLASGESGAVSAYGFKPDVTFVILAGSLLSPLPNFRPSAVGARLTLLPSLSFKSTPVNSGLSTVLKVNLFGVL